MIINNLRRKKQYKNIDEIDVQNIETTKKRYKNSDAEQMNTNEFP